MTAITINAMLADDVPEPVEPAILDRASLLAFVKTIKPKQHPTVTIEPAGDAWTFSHNGSRASVPTIAGTYPDFRQILGDGSEPVLFTVNPKYLADVLAVHGSEPVHVARASDSLSSPLFFTAADGTRHVVMPMMVDAQPERPRSAYAPAEAPPEPEPEPAPVAPEESAFRSIHAAQERVEVKRAERRANAGATPAISCPECGDPVTAADRFCGTCGLALAPVVAGLSAYSEANQRRILAQCPHASDVRGFRAWLDAGRVVRRGEKSIRIHAPITANVDGAQKVVRIKPTHVFDISQTDALPQEAAA